jgi:uncharacterized protein (DUF1697 family)
MYFHMTRLTRHDPVMAATWIAFLRAINIGNRQFPKAAIKAAVEAAGGTNVETYINTGNVRLDSTRRSRERLEQELERAFVDDRGFEVATIAFTPEELREIAADAKRFADGHDGRHYISLLKHEPTAEQVAAIEATARAGEVARVGGRAVHLLLGENYHTAKLSNAVVEKHCGVATNRNLTVIDALADRWGA